MAQNCFALGSLAYILWYPLPAVSTCNQRCIMASRPQVEIRGFQCKLRRMVDNNIDFAGSRTTRSYPKTTCALQSLRAALHAQMPMQRNHRPVKIASPTRKRKMPELPLAIPTASRKHHLQKWRMRKTIDDLRAKLASQTVAKQPGTKCKSISSDWIVRAFLATPSSNARGLGKSFREVVGMDAPTIS